MIRWNSSSDAYGVFAGLVDHAPIETRDQATHILHQARVRQLIAAGRRRERIAARVAATLIWALVAVVVFGVWALLSVALDSPRDHVGADELAHVQAGHQVVEVAQ